VRFYTSFFEIDLCVRSKLFSYWAWVITWSISILVMLTGAPRTLIKKTKKRKFQIEKYTMLTIKGLTTHFPTLFLLKHLSILTNSYYRLLNGN